MNHERNLYIINRQTGIMTDFLDTLWDTRDPKYINNSLIYSDDQSGIYNLFLNDGDNSGYITDVAGGAFKPDISKQGKIAFSIYQNGGYKLEFNQSLADNPKNKKGYFGDVFLFTCEKLWWLRHRGEYKAKVREV